MTSAKNEMIEESRSEGVQMAHDLGLRVREIDKKIVLAVEDVRDWVANRRNMDRNAQTLERPYTLRRALLKAGLKEPKRDHGEKQARFQITPARNKSHIVANFDIEAGTDWPALKPFYREIEEVEKM